MNIIKKLLDNDDILLKIRNKKYYLLSENEKYMLNTYLKYNNLVKYKKGFIDTFSERIKNNSSLVIELKDVIDFNISLKICKGTIKNIDFNMPTNTLLKEKPVGYSSDFYFNQLVENENYEELNNIYGIEEIEKNSNLIKKR